MEKKLILSKSIINNTNRISYINSYSGCFYSIYIIKKLLLCKLKYELRHQTNYCYNNQNYNIYNNYNNNIQINQTNNIDNYNQTNNYNQTIQTIQTIQINQINQINQTNNYKINNKNIDDILKSIELEKKILDFPFCGLYKLDEEIFIPEIKCETLNLEQKINLYNNLIKYKIYNIIRLCINNIITPIFNRQYIKNNILSKISLYKNQETINILFQYDKILEEIENKKCDNESMINFLYENYNKNMDNLFLLLLLCFAMNLITSQNKEYEYLFYICRNIKDIKDINFYKNLIIVYGVYGIFYSYKKIPEYLVNLLDKKQILFINDNLQRIFS